MGEPGEVRRYRSAVLRFGEIVSAVPEGRWAAASPCPGWTALDVVSHVIGGHGVLLAIIAGDPGPEPRPSSPDATEVLARWRQAQSATCAALDDPALPGRMLRTPLGEVDGATLLDMSLVEPLVHGWDLARAAGLDDTLDPVLAERCLQVAEQHAAMLRAPGMFAAEVVALESADAAGRLLAFLGRRV